MIIEPVPALPGLMLGARLTGPSIATAPMTQTRI
jgi:hypothetical protein